MVKIYGLLTTLWGHICRMIRFWVFCFHFHAPSAQSHALISSVSYSNPSISPPQSPSHLPPLSQLWFIFEFTFSWFQLMFFHIVFSGIVFFMCFASSSSMLLFCSVPYIFCFFSDVFLFPCLSFPVTLYVGLKVYVCMYMYKCTYTHKSAEYCSFRCDTV